MNSLPLQLLVVLVVAALGCQAGVINVVLIGATGNLAQKYLWQSLRNIDYEGKTPAKLKIWPAGTRPGMQQAIDTILANNVTYLPADSQEQFTSKVVGAYHQLSSSEHFAKLNQAISQSNAGEEEVGRIVYLSVPPKFFGGIASEIHQHLRPAENSTAYLKVIVEKPFGVDLSSALQLSRDLFQSLQEDEVLCVDHYMGKDTLRAIGPFRLANPDFVSHEFISKLDRVEVQMVETEDCQGRTSFYSEVGVMRDTMQNHLMMMLALFTMDLEKGEGEGGNDESVRRAQAVQQLYGGRITRSAQYSSYKLHEEQDHLEYFGKAMESKPSEVPTYAQVELKFKKASPFANVPFVFTSGKAMGQRRAFLRAVQKDGQALTFMVQGELDGIKGPAIHSSSGLAKIACPQQQAGWALDATGHLCVGPQQAPSAYQVLLNDLLMGDFDSFVSIPEVLHSWRVWTSLVSAETSNTYAVGSLTGLEREGDGESVRQEL